MGNYTNTSNVNVFTFNANNPLKVEDIEQIFNIDSDYGENEENYREDTLSLGYRSEAHRCAEEVLNIDEIKNIEVETDQIEAIVETVIYYNNGVTGFIIGNQDYCRNFEYDVSRVHDLIILAISHIS